MPVQQLALWAVAVNYEYRHLSITVSLHPQNCTQEIGVEDRFYQ
jgi:hypothetical protein